MGDSQPVAVPDGLIAAIRRRVDKINLSGGEEISGLPAGQSFARQDLYLTGYESIFDDCVSGNERVRRLHLLLRGELAPMDLAGEELNI